MAQLCPFPTPLRLLALANPPCHRERHTQLPIWGNVFPQNTRIGFGKYKGEVLGSLPDEYLKWMTHKLRGCMWANLAEEVIRERITLATMPLGLFEQDKRKSLPRSPVLRQSSLEDHKSASVQDKGERLKEALDQLDRGDAQPNSDTYASLLRQCANVKSMSQAKRLHGHIVKSGYGGVTILGNLLVHMYGNCGSVKDARSVFDTIPRQNIFSWNILIAAYVLNGQLDDARTLFDKMPQRDVVSWTSMITAYAQNGHGKEALEFFRQMELAGVNPNKITFVSVLDACASLAALAQGKGIHDRIVNAGCEADVVVGTALVNMYGKCGSLDDARCVFDKMPQRNVVSWTVMIASYAQNGSVDDARRVFNEMPKRDVVSWTAMIAAYAQHGYGKEALELFQQMVLEGVSPNKITFISVLDACASFAALEQGKEIHALIVDDGFELDVVVGTALVNMYGKCGSLDDARSVFDKMPQRDLVCWNAMIASYAQNGHGTEAIELLQQMDLNGVKPNKITFSSILFACSHAGLLDVGWQYFFSMSRDHVITPTAEHYGCMVDLIGRAAQLDEAEDLVNNMPFVPDVVPWTALLGACRIHGDVDRGASVARHVFKLDPNNDALYVLLANIYAAVDRWDDVTKVRMAMEDRGVKKHPACSCIEVNGRVHEFVVGEMLHPQKEELYAELKRLSRQMKVAGFMPTAVLHDVEEEEEEEMLCFHSEKLAIALGLISTPAGAPLRIIKNLRVCSNCHAAIKLISKIVDRKIIVRDANHFHHFEHGDCSCGEYR